MIKTLYTSVAAVAVLASAPALAQDAHKDKLREQYLYQQQQELNQQQDQQGAVGQAKPNSGPGVQGPPDTRTGPSTKAPAGSADAKSKASGNSNSGASSGESGSGTENTTVPSQDSSGVQGFPDTRTGPATKSPADGTKPGVE